MYIPTTFFCANASNLIISASAGTQGAFTSGSQLYGYNLFTTPGSASFTVFSGSVNNARLVIIGGGGGGMQGQDGASFDLAAGGGGAGGVYIDNTIAIAPRTYQIVVGAGGTQGDVQVSPTVITPATNGGSSSFSYPLYSTIGLGGGFGGYAGQVAVGDTPVRVFGGTGASGGGNAQFVNGTFVPTSSAQQGNSGGFISQSILGTNTAGGATGGGGAGAGSSGITDAMADSGVLTTAGGIGLQIPIYPINSNTASYFAGGGGAFGPGGSGASGGANKVQPGGLGFDTYGGGGNAGGSGAGRNPEDGRDGLVYIEYPIVTPLYPNTMINDGLTFWTTYSSLTGSYWYDISGNQNTGSVSGSTITPTNNLVPFNGTNNSILFPVTMSAQPSSSMTMIIYGQFISSSQNRDLFCREDYTNGWDTIYSYSNSRLTFRDNAGADGDLNVTQFVNQNVCYAITVTNNSQQSFVNGNKFSTATAPFNGFTAGGTKNLAFGFNANSDATYFSGSVSDLLLYNRILSQSEILSVYNYLRLNQSRPTY